MTVEFTQDVEKRRLLTRELPTWGLFNSTSIVQAVHFARDNGWFEGKVQVRAEQTYSDAITFYVEPKEPDCHCPSILRYADYFDPPQHG